MRESVEASIVTWILCAAFRASRILLGLQAKSSNRIAEKTTSRRFVKCLIIPFYYCSFNSATAFIPRALIRCNPISDCLSAVPETHTVGGAEGNVVSFVTVTVSVLVVGKGLCFKYNANPTSAEIPTSDPIFAHPPAVSTLNVEGDTTIAVKAEAAELIPAPISP
jgi:hypothetical protein